PASSLVSAMSSLLCAFPSAPAEAERHAPGCGSPATSARCAPAFAGAGGVVSALPAGQQRAHLTRHRRRAAGPQRHRRTHSPRASYHRSTGRPRAPDRRRRTRRNAGRRGRPSRNLRPGKRRLSIANWPRACTSCSPLFLLVLGCSHGAGVLDGPWAADAPLVRAENGAEEALREHEFAEQGVGDRPSRRRRRGAADDRPPHVAVFQTIGAVAPSQTCGYDVAHSILLARPPSVSPSRPAGRALTPPDWAAHRLGAEWLPRPASRPPGKRAGPREDRRRGRSASASAGRRAATPSPTSTGHWPRC